MFRIGGAPETDAQRAYSAALAAGADALVCGLSALALLGVGEAPLVPTICAPPLASARTPTAMVRRSPVAPVDRTYVGPIPTTTPARAILEAAAIVTPFTLEALLDDVLHARLATPSLVLGTIRRSATGRGRTGAPVLRQLLEPWLEGVQPGSPAEVRLLRRLSDWGFPEPERQHVVQLPGDRRAVIDLAWPTRLVGLEYDGERWHNERALAGDVAREESLRRLGWWIGRVDRHDLAPSSMRVRDELIGHFARRAA